MSPELLAATRCELEAEVDRRVWGLSERSIRHLVSEYTSEWPEKAPDAFRSMLASLLARR